MGILDELKKKYPEVEKITKRFLESACCDEDKGKKKNLNIKDKG